MGEFPRSAYYFCVTHILLIEDNPIDARFIHRIFLQTKDWPTRITWLADGEKALNYLEDLDTGAISVPPDLVLLDLNLPKYDGLQVLSALRRSKNAARLPVFLISSAPADTVRAEANGCGLEADGYFEKPYGIVGFEQIANQLRLYLESRATQPLLDLQVVGSAACC